jgi:uncharacterized protein
VLAACSSRVLLRSMIFHPEPGVWRTPGALGIDASDVWLVAEDGVRLHAYWLESPGATRALLYLHGNAGNASQRLPIANALRELGTHVLLLDYRGYGQSEGRPDEKGVQADARAALAHLTGAQRTPAERVVLFGSSLGGAIAVELACGQPLGGVILESTFSSLSDVARGVVPVLGPLLAYGQFDSRARIGQVRAPLQFFHGDRDEIVPLVLGRALFDAAPQPKQFEVLYGAGHNDTFEFGGRAYLAQVQAFLDRVAPD